MSADLPPWLTADCRGVCSAEATQPPVVPASVPARADAPTAGGWATGRAADAVFVRANILDNVKLVALLADGVPMERFS